MLSISAIKAGHGGGRGLAQYFEQESAQADYWAQEAQQNSRWWGQGAERLGLSSAVAQEDFVALMDGKLADGTVMLGSDRRLGYDLTFSAPKSVSAQALVGGDSRILAAHERAVDAAMQQIEARAAQTRIRAGDQVTFQKTGNFTAAIFQHATSRELDPQLHSHAVVANATFDGEKWRALSSEEIFRMKMLGGATYRATLSAELQELGYQVQQTKLDGEFEIVGIDKAQLDEAFSTRRQQIKERLAELGAEGARASAKATLSTRKAKATLSPEERQNLVEAWRERAEAAGIKFDLAQDKSLAPDLQARTKAAEAAVRHALEHLTERQTLVPTLALETKAMQRAVGSAGVEDVHAAIRKAVARGELVLTNRDGERFLTSQKALQREAQILGSLGRGQSAVPHVLDANSDRLAEITKGLNPGQAEAAKLILTSQDRLVGVQGYAGSGKTFMLSKVAQEARAQGYEVVGIAPTASAAQVLGKEIDAPGQTLAGHLQRRAPDVKAAGKQIWILDEAGLASTSQMRDFLAKAEREGARVVLVGDTKQLAAVEAGAPFRMLQENGMKTAEMAQVMRHKSDHLAKVVDQIRNGEGKKAVQAMQEAAGKDGGARLSWVEVNGKALKGLNPEEAAHELRQARLQASVDAYMESRAAGQDTLLVTERRADRRELNELVRDRLKSTGEISGEAVECSVTRSRDLTRAEARLVQAYQPGDRIEFGRDYKSLGVAKGEAAEVTGINAERGTVQLRKADGTEIDWSPARQTRARAFEVDKTELAAGDTITWTKNEAALDRRNGELGTVRSVDAEANKATVELADGMTQELDLSQPQHLDHGHAITVHKSQGRTADHVIVSGDLSGQESAYVAASRARDGAEFVASAEKAPATEAAGSRLEQAISEGRGKANAADDARISTKIHTLEAQPGRGADAAKTAETASKIEQALNSPKMREAAQEVTEKASQRKGATMAVPGLGTVQKVNRVLDKLDQTPAKESQKQGMGL